jgi:hypothetical protein
LPPDCVCMGVSDPEDPASDLDPIESRARQILNRSIRTQDIVFCAGWVKTQDVVVKPLGSKRDPHKMLCFGVNTRCCVEDPSQDLGGVPQVLLGMR